MFLLSFFPYLGDYIGHFYTGNLKKGLLFGSAELSIGMFGGNYMRKKYQRTLYILFNIIKRLHCRVIF